MRVIYVGMLWSSGFKQASREGSRGLAARGWAAVVCCGLIVMQHSQCVTPRLLAHVCGLRQLGVVIRFSQLGLLDRRASKSTEAQHISSSSGAAAAAAAA